MSLAVLKRKTKETYKTKKGGFSLNGHRRNISYIGKNYSALKTTLCNFTNHSYFNLDGTKNIANHNLIVNCDNVLPVDKDGIPISKPVSAKELNLDFKNSRKLSHKGKPIEIDHNFCISSNFILYFYINENFINLWVGSENYGGETLTAIFIIWIIFESSVMLQEISWS